MKIAALDTEHRMRRIGRQALYGIAPKTVSESSAMVEAVSATRANTALARYIDSGTPFIFASGPASAKRGFLDAAEHFYDRLGGGHAGKNPNG
jgi:hypothetical protein